MQSYRGVSRPKCLLFTKALRNEMKMLVCGRLSLRSDLFTR